MRAYFFGNTYMSSIQQGIQSAHTVVEMFNKYTPSFNGDPCYAFNLLDNWAREHKTMILLNGGYSSSIRELAKFFDSSDNPYPWATFCEGEDALDGALTCAGIILPERIYELAALIRQNQQNVFEKILFEEPSEWELELITKLNQVSLAH